MKADMPVGSNVPRTDMTTAAKCLLHLSLASHMLVLSARQDEGLQPSNL
jgi:hypothetical protein